MFKKHAQRQQRLHITQTCFPISKLNIFKRFHIETWATFPLLYPFCDVLLQSLHYMTKIHPDLSDREREWSEGGRDSVVKTPSDLSFKEIWTGVLVSLHWLLAFFWIFFEISDVHLSFRKRTATWVPSWREQCFIQNRPSSFVNKNKWINLWFYWPIKQWKPLRPWGQFS